MARKIVAQERCIFCTESPCACPKPGVGLTKPNPTAGITTAEEVPDGDA